MTNTHAHVSDISSSISDMRALIDLQRELEANLRILQFALRSPVRSEVRAAVVMVRGDLRRLVGGDDL